MARVDAFPLLRTFVQDYNNGWVPSTDDLMFGGVAPVYVMGYAIGDVDRLANLMRVRVLRNNLKLTERSSAVRALHIEVVSGRIGLEQFLNELRDFAHANALYLVARPLKIASDDTYTFRSALVRAGWYVGPSKEFSYMDTLILAPGNGKVLRIADGARAHPVPLDRHVPLKWNQKPSPLPAVWSELCPGLARAFNRLVDKWQRAREGGAFDDFADRDQGLFVSLGLNRLHCPFTGRMEYALVCYLIELDEVSRGRGVGRSILDHMELIAKWVGVHLVIDTVVNPRLYNHLTKRGFLDEDLSTPPGIQAEKLPPINTPMEYMEFIGHMWKLFDSEKAYVEP